ncbi:MAG: aspartate aminotransferase family protein [Gammaproteobacteria bacterium]|nr:aspartate aminotransferase family protein [Gammaproteobacteria bacterium]
MSNTLMSNYKRLPVTFARGEGAWLWDTQSKRYLDALSGIGVCGLGHAHPAIRDAICEQAGSLIHTSNLYGIEHQQTLADALARLSGMESAFFCNSGAEANEAAIKIARLAGYKKGITGPGIVVVENSFHGRTLAALSATGNAKMQTGFGPLAAGFIRIPYNDLDTLAKTAQRRGDIVAILVEPVLGEGGVKIPDLDYLNGVRSICDAHGWLMMLDEVQTGMGRSGRWFAYQHNGILPDVLCLAKGLGNGMPIGVCLARGKAAQMFQAGSHGSTFGGNPLACRAALAVIETIEKEDLCRRAEVMGKRIQQGLSASLADLPGVTAIRNKGLMLGIELANPCAALVDRALQRRLLINVTAEKIVRLLPPLIINEDQADEIVTTLKVLIKDFLAGR